MDVSYVFQGHFQGWVTLALNDFPVVASEPKQRLARRVKKVLRCIVTCACDSQVGVDMCGDVRTLIWCDSRWEKWVSGVGLCVTVGEKIWL